MKNKNNGSLIRNVVVLYIYIKQSKSKQFSYTTFKILIKYNFKVRL